MVSTLALGLIVIGIAYGWRRSGFYMPGSRGRTQRTGRLLVRLAGWTIVAVGCGYALGGVVGGRTQIAKIPTVQYASRATEPWAFWRQIAFEMGVSLVVGGALVGLSRPQGEAVDGDAR